MVEVTGHRGAAGYEPENTLRSFRKALEIGVDNVEFDVHLSRDGYLVVIHDVKVDRTTNARGDVGSLTLDELRKLDAGMGERIPTLQEAIDYLKDKAVLQIELKGVGTEEPAVRLVEGNRVERQVVFTSFDHTRVKRVKELNPSLQTGVLIVGRPIDPVAVVKGARADGLHINYEAIDRALVEDVHRGGLKVSVWNIDEAEDVDLMVDLGVDAIGSNKPDIVIARLRARGLRKFKAGL